MIHLQNTLQLLRLFLCQSPINSYKTEFVLNGLQKLDEIQNSSLRKLGIGLTRSAHNFGLIFDEHLLQPISAISKACYYYIKQLPCIRPYLHSTTACTTATSIVTPNSLTAILYLQFTTYLSLRLLPPTDSELSCPCSC